MEDQYKLFRCSFAKITKEYIIGKDRNGKKYYIIKNEASKNYKVGGDESFYAKLDIKGAIFKKLILEPIRYEEYLNLINKNKIGDMKQTS